MRTWLSATPGDVNTYNGARTACVHVARSRHALGGQTGLFCMIWSSHNMASLCLVVPCHRSLFSLPNEYNLKTHVNILIFASD